MKNSPRYMFAFGILTFIVITIIALITDLDSKSAVFWIFRVCIALAASAISISIPGMIQVNYTPSKNDKGFALLTDEENKPKPMTLAEKESTITASGAIAVFVLVYLFDPISFYI